MCLHGALGSFCLQQCLVRQSVKKKIGYHFLFLEEPTLTTKGAHSTPIIVSRVKSKCRQHVYLKITKVHGQETWWLRESFLALKMCYN
jgi:hypothetical protein